MEDDGYSSGDSESTLRSSVFLNLGPIPISTDQNAYKKDKSCIVCNKSFTMIGAMKKHFCKFCFRGVCSGCSKHSAPSSISGRNERICDLCYQRAIQGQVKDSLEKDLEKEKNDVQNIQQRLNFEIDQRKTEMYRKSFLEGKLNEIKEENLRKEKELAEESVKLNKDIKDMKADIEELTKGLNRADPDKRKKDEEILGLKCEIVNLKTESQNDIERINELKRLVEEQEIANANLTKEFSSHMEIPGDTEDPLGRGTLLDELKYKFNQAKEQNKDLKKENDALKKKLSLLKEENANKKAEIARLEEGGELTRTMSKVSNDIKDLEDQIAYQEQEIARLLERLKNTGRS